MVLAVVGITKADRAFKEQNDAMREEIAHLQSTMANLRERNKTLAEQLEKKKGELAKARKDKDRLSTTATRRPLSASSTVKREIEIVAGPNPRASAHPHPVEEPVSDTNWFAIAQQLKARWVGFGGSGLENAQLTCFVFHSFHRLKTAEEQILQLNEQLARARATPATAKGPVSYPMSLLGLLSTLLQCYCSCPAATV